MEMLVTRQKFRAGENPHFTQRTQPETNICEVRTPSRTVFTHEQNELLFQQVVKYSQEREGEYLHYHVLGLNESSTDNNTKKAYRKLALQSHRDKNKHPQASVVMSMINKA